MAGALRRHPTGSRRSAFWCEVGTTHALADAKLSRPRRHGFRPSRWGAVFDGKSSEPFVCSWLMRSSPRAGSTEPLSAGSSEPLGRRRTPPPFHPDLDAGIPFEMHCSAPGTTRESTAGAFPRYFASARRAQRGIGQFLGTTWRPASHLRCTGLQPHDWSLRVPNQASRALGGRIGRTDPQACVDTRRRWTLGR